MANATALLAIIDSSLAPLLSLLLWLLVVSFLYGLFYRPRLRLTFNFDRLHICGQPGLLEFDVVNAGPFAAYDLHLRFQHNPTGLRIATQQAYIGELQAGNKTTVTFEMVGVVRGEHWLPSMQVASLFPFGMFRFVSHHSFAQPVLVAPQYELLTTDELLGESGEARLGALDSASRKAFEYVGSRVFRQGMQVRRWDFAAWARHGVPAIREFNEVHTPTAAIVVDAIRIGAGTIDEYFESLLSRTATACVSLISNGFQVQLFLVGDKLECFGSLSERDPADAILRTLARAQGVRKQIDWEIAWTQMEQFIEPDSLLIAYLRSENAPATFAFVERSKPYEVAIKWTPDSRRDSGNEGLKFSRAIASERYEEA